MSEKPTSSRREAKRFVVDVVRVCKETPILVMTEERAIIACNDIKV